MQPDPNGRLAALQTASQGQPASPGANPGFGPNVQNGGAPLPPELEAQAKQEAVQNSVTEVLARLNVLEQTLLARGVIQHTDLDPRSAPGAAPVGPDAGAVPGAPPAGGAPGGPVPGAPAAPSPMGQGPRQPY